MKNRSELREVAMKALYQVYIYENTNTGYDVKTIIKEFEESDRKFNVVNNSKDENVSPYFIEIKHYEDAQHNTLDKEMTFEDYLNSIVKDNKNLPLGSIVLNEQISERTL